MSICESLSLGRSGEPFDRTLVAPASRHRRRHRSTDRSDTRSAAAISRFFSPPSKRSTACSRIRSRAALPASVKPPPCAYLTVQGYRNGPGAVRRTVPTSPNQVQYLGVGIDDTATGLTHIGAREYDQNTGRFLSADPLIDFADPLQMNGYTYANGNPVSSSDPTGLAPDDCANNGVSCSPNTDGSWDTKPTTEYAKYNGATVTELTARATRTSPLTRKVPQREMR